MKIFFDHRWIGNHGIGRFARILDQRLALPHLTLSGRPTSPVDPLRMWFTLNNMPKDICVFSPGYNAPLFMVRPYILTIHDLNHLDRSENTSLLKRLYYFFVIRRAVRHASKVLTVSEFSRQRIITWSNVDSSKVVNVGNGVDLNYHPNAPPHDPGYPYLFCVGNRKAHKNEFRVLEAFSTADIDDSVKLVFSGYPVNSMIQFSEQKGITERVVYAGHISEKDMPGYYRGALGLVFPSLYEGFGLPIIESMACGTPVLTSTVTSLPEVAGGGALLVDPLSVREIAEGIERLCTDFDLRDELIHKGLDRAAQFTWDKVASRVSSVLAELDGRD